MAVDFNLIKLVLTIRLESDVANPLILYDMRGEFLDAFRRTVNCVKTECAGCRTGLDCPAFHALAQSITSDPTALKRYQKPPLPFVFEFLEIPPPPNRGMCFECAFTIVGSAINHLDFYLAALRLMFESKNPRRRFSGTLLSVESCDYQGGRSLIWARKSLVPFDRLHLLSALELPQIRPFGPERLSLTFLTPLRLVHDGRPLQQISFSLLFRTLLRRISSLAYYYGGEELELDYKWLSERSVLIECQVDNCQYGAPVWGASNQRLCGLTGNAVFTGDLSAFHLPLFIGEYVHLGKGASFGLGQYRITG